MGEIPHRGVKRHISGAAEKLHTQIKPFGSINGEMAPRVRWLFTITTLAFSSFGVIFVDESYVDRQGRVGPGAELIPPHRVRR